MNQINIYSAIYDPIKVLINFYQYILTHYCYMILNQLTISTKLYTSSPYWEKSNSW